MFWGKESKMRFFCEGGWSWAMWRLKLKIMTRRLGFFR